MPSTFVPAIIGAFESHRSPRQKVKAHDAVALTNSKHAKMALQPCLAGSLDKTQVDCNSSCGLAKQVREMMCLPRLRIAAATQHAATGGSCFGKYKFQRAGSRSLPGPWRISKRPIRTSLRLQGLSRSLYRGQYLKSPSATGAPVHVTSLQRKMKSLRGHPGRQVQRASPLASVSFQPWPYCCCACTVSFLGTEQPESPLVFRSHQCSRVLLSSFLVVVLLLQLCIAAGVLSLDLFSGELFTSWIPDSSFPHYSNRDGCRDCCCRFFFVVVATGDELLVLFSVLFLPGT